MIIEKQIYCPTCKKPASIFLDKDQFKESTSGINKRTYQHNDHYLLLDVDGNADIRSEKSIDMISPSRIPVEKVTNLVDRINGIKEMTYVHIYDEPSYYEQILVELLEQIFTQRSPFTFDQTKIISLDLLNLQLRIGKKIEDTTNALRSILVVTDTEAIPEASLIDRKFEEILVLNSAINEDMNKLREFSYKIIHLSNDTRLDLLHAVVLEINQEDDK